jgi:dTDP-4-amino-4,6-dideoxygalactose transaminase
MLPEELEKKITNRTKAVIFVDALGNPSGIHEIKKICQKHNIILIEDAACAIGSSEFGNKCGNIADLTCFSFHPRKLLTTGEGGAITTNNEEFAKKLDVKLNHGSIFKNDKFDFVDFGYNYRLPELQAIMGIKQIKKLDSIIKNRNEVRDHFVKCLQPLDFKVQRITSDVIHNVQSLVFVLPARIDRNSLIQKLKVSGVETTLGTYSLSACTFYRNKYNNVQSNSSYLEKHTLTIPCYEGLDVEKVFKAIGEQV